MMFRFLPYYYYYYFGIITYLLAEDTLAFSSPHHHHHCRAVLLTNDDYSANLPPLLRDDDDRKLFSFAKEVLVSSSSLLSAILSISLLTVSPFIITSPVFAASDSGASIAANSKITTGGASTLQSGRVSVNCVCCVYYYRKGCVCETIILYIYISTYSVYIFFHSYLY